MFIMPLPYGTQMLAGFFPFTCSGKFATGVIMISVAAANVSAVLTARFFILLVLNIFISAVVVIALSYLVSSLAFYAPAQCEEISSSVRYGAEYTATFPLSGMPRYMVVPLVTVFPAGLIAWLPTLIILGRAPVWANVYPLAFAAMLSVAAAYCFGRGFRYYVRRSINRYAAFGHRS